ALLDPEPADDLGPVDDELLVRFPADGVVAEPLALECAPLLVGRRLDGCDPARCELAVELVDEGLVAAPLGPQAGQLGARLAGRLLGVQNALHRVLAEA